MRVLPLDKDIIRIPNQNRAVLRRIFFISKSVLANKKKGFSTNSDPNKQEVGFIFV
jgi:hypothetical protein